MGLDAWLYTFNPKFVDKEPFNYSGDEVVYWRKHHDLHRWMERLYYKRGGKEEFNLVPLFLSKDDLDRLEQDIINNRLQYTTSFFSSTEEAKNYDLKAVKSAKACLALGNLVYYNSWW